MSRTLKLFAVYDSKVGTYDQPFTMRTTGEAIRSWQTVVNDPKTQFFAHPEDYTLFELAEYNIDTGKFENTLTPISHGVAKEFHKGTPQQNLLNIEGAVR